VPDSYANADADQGADAGTNPSTNQCSD